jgi:Glycosyl transferases group 1
VRRGLGGTATLVRDVVSAGAFSGFLTTGILGEQYLAGLGVDHGRIALGLRPTDVASWQRGLAAAQERTRALRTRVSGASFVVVVNAALHDLPAWAAIREAFARLEQRIPGAALLAVDDTERDAAAWYGAADVLLCAPTQATWGQSVLDALACSMPVVAATTIGCAADVLVHGRNGALCYAGDPASIADALQLVAASPDRTQLRAAAGAAVQRFDEPAVVAATRGFLAELETCARHAPRPILPLLRSIARNEFGRWTT